eukprot:CAMPEP_0115039410 /NCGR_PEP_ID=MMETSP0216-20121206/44011_1 /TAXON_ID=223996 /ORGANISM="Protocruzia adherens, Strain Boccale" /LENGTH=165 /DNA_ID=CAMNT_0002420043 /DNA_START=64 /DNA_END=561 /DNA_ORIENTATION=+
MASGDVLMQTIEYFQAKQKASQHGLPAPNLRYDGRRVLNMSIYGLGFGLFAAKWYTAWLPRLIGNRSKSKLRIVCEKVMFDEFIQSPFYYLSFLPGMTMLSGGSINDAVQKTKKDFFRLLISDWIVWPPIQFLNFWFVPNHMQAFVVSSVSVFWAAYLSYVQNDG